jgi:hypothetical protein
MRWLLLIALVACGGSKPPPPKPKDPEPPRPTRVPIEDSSTDTEDGVEVINARGVMDTKLVEAGLAPHKEALSDCYMSRVGKRKWLGGHVVIKWDISKTGEVTSVKLAESDLGAWPIEKCLIDIARSATFGKPKGGDADFTIPLDFTAKGKAMSWDEDQALRAVGGQVAKLDECVKPPKGKPNAKPIKMPSDVTVTVYVGPAGKAQSVGFASAKSELDEHWAECAEKIAMAWRLPDPKGQYAKLAVKYRP